jgi:hypothetical protein
VIDAGCGSRILRLRRKIPLLFLREEFEQFVWISALQKRLSN